MSDLKNRGVSPFSCDKKYEDTFQFSELSKKAAAFFVARLQLTDIFPTTPAGLIKARFSEIIIEVVWNQWIIS